MVSENTVRSIVTEALEPAWTKFSEVDKRLEAIDKRFEAVDRRFDGVDRELREVKEMQHRQGLKIDDMQKNITLIAEAILPLAAKSQTIDRHDEDLAEQKTRLDLTQQALRQHIASKKLHVTE